MERLTCANHDFGYRYSSDLVYEGKAEKGSWMPPANCQLTGGPRWKSFQNLWFEESQRSVNWLRINGAWSQEAT